MVREKDIVIAGSVEKFILDFDKWDGERFPVLHRIDAASVSGVGFLIDSEGFYVLDADGYFIRLVDEDRLDDGVKVTAVVTTATGEVLKDVTPDIRVMENGNRLIVIDTADIMRNTPLYLVITVEEIDIDAPDCVRTLKWKEYIFTIKTS